MKTAILLLFTVGGIQILLSQVPFSTPFKEPLALKEVKDENGIFKEYELVDDDESIKNILEGNLDNVKKNESIIINKDLPKLGFFKNNSLTANIIGDETRYSINSEVLFFKLYIASPSKDFFKRRVRQKQTQKAYMQRIPTYRLNLPLMLITKLSTNYDSISSSNAIDALDYEGAPITLRIMPSFIIDFEKYNDVINFGFYSDLRGLNLTDDTLSDTNELEFVGSFGAGFTYHGDGEAGSYNEEGNYSKGKYSISGIFQAVTGKEEVIQSLFDTDKSYATSFQGFFIFNTIGETRFDIKIGYQYFFDRTMGGARSNFTIGLSN